jgi:chromosome partitioning protein
MQTLAVVSQKGGAGKTTLSFHLAVEAERQGLPCVLLDTDPQASARRWADRRNGTMPEVVAAPSSRLPQLIEAAARGGAALVVIDTPPHADQSALHAMRAADLVLVPVRPSALDLDSVLATLDLAEIARCPVLGVINQAPHNGLTADEARSVLAKRGAPVARQVIRQRVALHHGIAAGMTAQEYEPDGKAAGEVAALFQEIAARLGITDKLANRQTGLPANREAS